MDWSDNYAKQSAVRAVSINGLNLKKYPQYQDDIDVVSAAVQQNGLALQFASQTARDSYENVVRLAVESQPMAIVYAPKFQSDDVIAKIAVRGDGLTLKYFQALTDKREIVEIAVSNNGLALEFAPKYKNDRDIVVEAVKNNGLALQFASLKLRGDIEVVLLAEKEDSRALSYATTKAQNTISKYRKQIEKFKNGKIKLANISESLFDHQVFVDELKEACKDRFYNQFKDKIKEDPKLKETLDRQIKNAVEQVHNRYEEHQLTSKADEFNKTMKEILDASENL